MAIQWGVKEISPEQAKGIKWGASSTEDEPPKDQPMVKQKPEPLPFSAKHPNLYGLYGAAKETAMEPVRLAADVITGGAGAFRKGMAGIHAMGEMYRADPDKPGSNEGLQAGMNSLADDQASIQQWGNFIPHEPSHIFSAVGDVANKGTSSLHERAMKESTSPLESQLLLGLEGGIQGVMDKGMLEGGAGITKGAWKNKGKAVDFAKAGYEHGKDFVIDPKVQLKRAESKLDSLTSRVLKNEKKAKFPEQARQDTASAQTVAEDIYKYSKNPETSFRNADGEEITDRTPENRLEMAQVVEDRMKQIYDKYSKTMQEFGQGNISLMPLIKDMHSKIQEWKRDASTRDLVPKAVQTLTELMRDQRRKGGLSLQEVDQSVRNWGRRIQDVKNPGADSIPNDIIKPIVDYLRNTADKTLDENMAKHAETVLDPTEKADWLKDRKLYSDYRKFSKNVTQDMVKHVAEQTKSKVNVWDTLAVIGGLKSVLFHDPSMAVMAGATEAINAWRKLQRNPDTAIKRMFKTVEDVERTKAKIPAEPEPESVKSSPFHTPEDIDPNKRPDTIGLPLENAQEGAERANRKKVWGAEDVEHNPITPPTTRGTSGTTPLVGEQADLQRQNPALGPAFANAESIDPRALNLKSDMHNESNAQGADSMHRTAGDYEPNPFEEHNPDTTKVHPLKSEQSSLQYDHGDIPADRFDTSPKPIGAPGENVGRGVEHADAPASRINLSELYETLKGQFPPDQVQTLIKAARSIGIPAAIVGLYNMTNDENKKKMLGIPMLASTINIFGKKGTVPKEVNHIGQADNIISSKMNVYKNAINSLVIAIKEEEAKPRRNEGKLDTLYAQYEKLKKEYAGIK